MDFTPHLGQAFSRRRFMKSALFGAGAVTLGSRLAMAQALATGKQPLTAKDIHGWGAEPGVVRINANENPLGASPRAIEAVAEHLFEMNRYMFSTDLPFKLHRYHGITFGNVELDFDDPRTWMEIREKMRIVVEAGSGPLLQAIAILGVGDGNGEAIEAVPAYGQISRTFETFKEAGYRTNVIGVPTTGDFVHDLDAMKAAITPKTTLIAITNPNNPTGTIVPYEKLEAFVDAVPKHVTVLIDEAYIHFVRDPEYRDAINLALTRENVVVTRTFSKIFGLAGMRIGYLVANKPLLDRIQLYTGFGGGLTVLSTYAATAALDDHAFVERTKRVTAEGKDFLYAEFDKMGLKYTKSHANFMIVDVGKDSRRVSTELRKRGVLIRSGWSYGPALKNHIRVSVGTPQELEVFINEFKNVMGVAS